MPYKNQQRKIERQRERRAEQRARQRGAGTAALPLETPEATGARRAAALCEWIEGELVVPDGPGEGKPFNLGEWQRDYFEGALDPSCREAGLSIARRNGKTYSVALLCLGYLAGPLATKTLKGAAVSLTAQKSTILRDAIVKIAEASDPDAFGLHLRRSPYPGELTGPTGASILFLSADKASGHGYGLHVAIVDEMGLMAETDRDLIASLRSALGGLDGQLIAMSVRGDCPMYEEMRERRAEKDVYWLEYSARAKCDLDDETQWAAANPGLGATKSMARTSPSASHRCTVATYHTRGSECRPHGAERTETERRASKQSVVDRRGVRRPPYADRYAAQASISALRRSKWSVRA